MTNRIDRRVMLGGAAATLCGVAAPISRATQKEVDYTPYLEKLRGMTWDRRTRDNLYQSRRASVETIDYAGIFMDNREWAPPKPTLTYPELAIIRQSAEAALKWYHSRGFDVPLIPVLGGKFVIFFAHDLDGSSGMTGEAIGVVPFLKRAFMAPYVPKGCHILYNAAHFRNYYPDHPWSRQLTIAHEIVHAIDAEMRKRDGDDVGGWVGEGLSDALAQAAVKSIGYDPMAALQPGKREHGKNIGLRPYDYPLALNFASGRALPVSRPAWTSADPKQKDTPGHVAAFWQKNATYFTQSFWRFLFHEHAGRDNTAEGGKQVTDDYKLCSKFKRLQLTDDDVAKATGNIDMDGGVALLDRFIRRHHPAYMAAGLYRAFPAFIAHFVEWPDQVIRSRRGIMAHPKWIEGMFHEGAQLLPITEFEGIDHVIREVRPLAARAIRFKLPPLITSDEGYPRVSISVTALNGGPDAIDNIHLGVRGQCLANHLSQRSQGGSGRTRRWTMVDVRPLMHAAVNGESILTFINCAPDACKSRPVSIRVSVVAEMAQGSGQLFYAPKPRLNQQGQEVTPPRSTSPAMGKRTPALPTLRGSEEIEIAILQDEALSKLTQGIARTPGALGMVAERETDSTAKATTPEELVALTQQLAMPSGLSQLTIRLAFPRVEPGHRGAVHGGKAIASWFEPRYPQLKLVGLGGQVTMETDRLEVTIVSSTEGALIGTFKADFGSGTLDPEQEFGGVVTGNFSVGVALDDNHPKVMPVDPAALVNTDFFHAMSMSGMTGEQMIEALGKLRESDGDSDSGTDGPAAGETSGGQEQDDRSGKSNPPAVAPSVPSQGAIDACARTVTKRDLDQALRHLHGDLAKQNPDIARQLRETYLADWENTKRLICLWKATGAVP